MPPTPTGPAVPVVDTGTAHGGPSIDPRRLSGKAPTKRLDRDRSRLARLCGPWVHLGPVVAYFAVSGRLEAFLLMSGPSAPFPYWTLTTADVDLSTVH